MSEAYIAVVAKQASDYSRIMAMIHVKIFSFSAGFFRTTYPAFASLCCEHVCILAGFEAIVLLSSVIVKAFAVPFSCVSLVFGGFIQILSPPIVLTFSHALSAVHAKTCLGIVRLMKVSMGLMSRAAITPFRSFCENTVFRHTASPMLNEAEFCQGAC